MVIFAALSNVPVTEVHQRFDGAEFSQFKKELIELAVEVLSPITTEMQRLVADPGYVDSVLRDGAERAAELATPIVKEVQDIMGFLRP